jgi:hypothetical protein
VLLGADVPHVARDERHDAVGPNPKVDSISIASTSASRPDVPVPT